MYSAIDLSKYIVTKCIHDGYPISNLQLQKILCSIQKAFIDKGSSAFADEIEEWNFGSAVPEAYYYFCGFGAMPITLTYDDVNIDACDKAIIDFVVDSFIKEQLC